MKSLSSWRFEHSVQNRTGLTNQESVFLKPLGCSDFVPDVAKKVVIVQTDFTAYQKSITGI
jgi:hypothetical protein